MKASFNFELLRRVIHKYQEDAERCLQSRAYFAGLVAVRAALETALILRLLLELYDFSDIELRKCGLEVAGDTIKLPGKLNLKELIQTAYEANWINQSGFAAAERIRKWGNRIHCSRVASGKKLPAIGRRNLEARLNDLDIVSKQLLRTL